MLQRQASGAARHAATGPFSLEPVVKPVVSAFRGRRFEVERLSIPKSSFILVIGPPGVGKTRLLEESAVSSREGGGQFAQSDVVELEFRSGTLQASLLGALGTALATHESGEDLSERWGRVFQGAFDNAADAAARDMVSGATAVMNGIVRARLGEEAADALQRFEGGLTQALDERLARRIDAEADPGVMRAFCTLAEQVQAFVGGPVVLTLDRAERLADPDFRQLLDLIEILPQDVHVQLGHTRVRPSHEERITEFRSAGSGKNDSVQVLDLDGLDSHTVAEWMTDVGLEPDREAGGLDEVMRVTAGYPLHVDLVLGAIERGDPLDHLTGDDSVQLMIEQNYRDLPSDDQFTLMVVAAFTDPPDEEIILDVLGVDASEWAVRERRLVHARFFVSVVEGKQWFHELGRRLLWDKVLSEGQRKTAATRAAHTLLAHIGSTDRFRISYCIDLAALIRFTPESLDAHAGARRVLDLEPVHLAVMGALEELTGADNPSGFIGDVVSHARSRFSTDGDLYLAVDDLNERSLVVAAADERDQVLVPFWGSKEARALGLGRIINTFGRVPLTTAASKILHGVVLPHCGPFHVASLGTGFGTLTAFSRELKERQHDRDAAHVSFQNRPGILLRGTMGSLGFGGAVSFHESPSRDRALTAIASELTPDRMFGESWRLEVYAWPQIEPLPARRFTDAVTLLTGVALHKGLRIPNLPDLPPVRSHLEQMDMTVRTWRTLTALAGGLEADVLDLAQPRGIAFAAGDAGVYTAEILGRHGVMEIEAPDAALFSLAFRRELDRAIGLGAGERIIRTHHRPRGEPYNPTPEIVKQTYADMKAFNDAQGSDNRVNAPWDADWIRRAVLANLNQRQTDAQAFINAGLFPAPPLPLGTELFIVARGAPGNTRYRDSWDTSMIVGRRRVDGQNSVELRILDHSSSDERSWDALSREFGFSIREQGVSVSSSNLGMGLENLLGYDRVLPDYG